MAFPSECYLTYSFVVKDFWCETSTRGSSFFPITATSKGKFYSFIMEPPVIPCAKKSETSSSDGSDAQKSDDSAGSHSDSSGSDDESKVDKNSLLAEVSVLIASLQLDSTNLLQRATFRVSSRSKSAPNTVTVAAKDLFDLDNEDIEMVRVASSRPSSRAATIPPTSEMDDGSSGYNFDIDDDMFPPGPQDSKESKCLNHGQNDPKLRRRGRSPVWLDDSEDDMFPESIQVRGRTRKVVSRPKVCYHHY